MSPVEADGTITNAWRASDPRVLEALRDAEVGELHLVYDSSNYVFVATLTHPELGDGVGVYKPARGERPLHDFPGGTLHRREVGAFELSRLLGWDLVPPTVERDGPHGVGSMQLFVEHHPAEHYFHLRDSDDHDEQLVRMAAFDLVANNADRKGGHLLLDEQGHVWGIDNGLCFHRVEKLRTVIWDYAGTRLPARWVADLERVAAALDDPADEGAGALRGCLGPGEATALAERMRALAAEPVLPEMYPWRCVPWPMI